MKALFFGDGFVGALISEPESFVAEMLRSRSCNALDRRLVFAGRSVPSISSSLSSAGCTSATGPGDDAIDGKDDAGGCAPRLKDRAESGVCSDDIGDSFSCLKACFGSSADFRSSKSPHSMKSLSLKD